MTLTSLILVVYALMSMILRSALPVDRLLAIGLIDKSWVYSDVLLWRRRRVFHLMINHITSPEGWLSWVVDVHMTAHVIHLSHGINSGLLIKKHCGRHIDDLRSRIRFHDEWVHWTAIALLQVVSTLIIHHSVWLLRRKISSCFQR